MSLSLKIKACVYDVLVQKLREEDGFWLYAPDWSDQSVAEFVIGMFERTELPEAVTARNVRSIREKEFGPTRKRIPEVVPETVKELGLAERVASLEARLDRLAVALTFS